MKLKFSMPVIIIDDIQISKRFYQDLFDLEIEEDFGEYISFTCGFGLWERKRAHEIIFDEAGALSGGSRPKDLELYFETDDMEGTVELIEASEAELIHPVKEESWGQRSIRFFDPDGFIVEVGESIPVFLKRMMEDGLSIEEAAARSQMSVETVKGILSNE